MRHFHHCIRSNNYLSYCRFHCSETYSYSRFHCSETYSYSRFHCNETRVIFITGYAAVTTLVIPASIAVILASFSSQDTLQHVLIVIPVSTAVKHASFSSPITYSYSRFHCSENASLHKLFPLPLH